MTSDIVTSVDSKPHIDRYDDDGMPDTTGDWVHWDDAERLIEQLQAIEQERDEWKRVAENLARDPESEDA